MAKQRTTVVNIDYNVLTEKIERSNVLLEKSSKATDDFRSTINKTKTSSDSLAASLTKVGDDGVKSFLSLSNLIKAISFTALASGIATVAKKIFDLGVAQEQTNIAFETLVGNTERAKRLLAELAKFSLDTPFTPDQVNRAAKSLLAFGVQAEDVIPTLKLLGDVSSGTGKDLSEMAVIFGQIRSTGRLMGQDLLQLINAGFNPLQIISKETGRSMRDLKKDMENGLISFQMVEDAFKSATSEGGLFFNLMEKQSKSIGGMLSTIEGNIDEISKKLFETRRGALAELTQGVVEITSETDAWADTIDNLITVLKPNVAIAFYNSIKNRAEEARKTTARLRMEELALQLAIAKGDLDTFNQTGLGDRVKIIERIVRLLDEMGVRQPTTEDPLPWAGKQQGEEKVGIIEKLEQRIKTLNEEIKKTQDLGDLGASGKLIIDLKNTQAELDRLNGKQSDTDKKADKEAEKRRKEALENTRKYLRSIYEHRKKAGDDANKREAENDKRSFELWKYYQDLKVQKQKEYDEEAFRIAEDQAAIKRERDQAIAQLGEDLLRDSLMLLFTSRAEDTKNISDYYDEQIKLAGDNDRAKKELQIRRDRELDKARERQKEKDKEAARIKILIDGLIAIGKIFADFGWPAGIAPAAIMAGITAVNVAAVDKYKDGGWIKGPGTETSDSVPIMASKNEFMVNASSAKKSPKLLEKINSGKLNDRLLRDIMSGKSGGHSVTQVDIAPIVSGLKDLKESQPDIVLRSNLVYEGRKRGDKYKRWIRSKSMS